MGKRGKRGRNNKGKEVSKYKPILVPFESKFTQNAISADDAENHQENGENDVVGNFERDAGEVEAVRFDNADRVYNVVQDLVHVLQFVQGAPRDPGVAAQVNAVFGRIWGTPGGEEQIYNKLEDLQQLLQLLQGIAQQVPGQAFHARISGLTRERIGKFEHFSADESLVGEQCVVCLEDLQVGTQMVRLDCHVSHYLCKTCTDAWFKDHEKCPTCNHVFK